MPYLLPSRLGNRYDLNTEEQNNRHNCQNNIAKKNNSRLGNRYDLNTEEQNNRHNCQNNIAKKNN